MATRLVPVAPCLPPPLRPKIRAKAKPRHSTVKAGIKMSTIKHFRPIGSMPSAPRPSSPRGSADRDININKNRPQSDYMLCIDCRMALLGGPIWSLTEANLGRVIRSAMLHVIDDTTIAYLEPWHPTRKEKVMFKLKSVRPMMGYHLVVNKETNRPSTRSSR